jgi:hypothetical protein
MNALNGTGIFSKPRGSWVQYREASLNWLALGLLLAAWNAADSDEAADVPRRPESLRAYSCVSARAVHRAANARLCDFVMSYTRPAPDDACR